jgi:hypothetical protein
MRRDRYQRTEVSDQIGQSREELFTPRRQGAKAAYESKDRIPFLTLSGLASLREIAAIKGREEFFTLRREVAKEIFESKHRISFLNLSVLASLREIAVTQGKPASARSSGLARAGLHSKPAPFDSAQGKLGRKER